METRKKIEAYVSSLSRSRSKPWISTYMSAGAVPFSTYQPDSRFRNLVRNATDLWRRSYGSKDRNTLVLELSDERQNLTRRLKEPDTLSVAAFKSRGSFHVLPLPVRSRDQIVAGDRPHLKPLFIALSQRKPFWLVEFETGYTRFHWSDGFDLSVVTTISALQPGKNDIRLDVASRARGILQRKRAPVLLAGSPTIVRSARSLLKGFEVMQRELVGQTFRYDCQQLMYLASGIIEDYFGAKRLDSLSLYHARKRVGGVTTEPERIVKELARGGVEHLYLADDAASWGTVDWDFQSVEVHDVQQNAHDNDVSGLLAQKAFTEGVALTFLPRRDMPERATMAAVVKMLSFPERVMPLSLSIGGSEYGMAV